MSYFTRKNARMGRDLIKLLSEANQVVIISAPYLTKPTQIWTRLLLLTLVLVETDWVVLIGLEWVVVAAELISAST